MHLCSADYVGMIAIVVVAVELSVMTEVAFLSATSLYVCLSFTPLLIALVVTSGFVFSSRCVEMLSDHDHVVKLLRSQAQPIAWPSSSADAFV